MTAAAKRVTGHPAGLVRRLGALLYDVLLIIAIWMMTLFGLVLANDGEAVGGVAVQGLMLVEWIAYYAYAWRRTGQTLGMKSWRIVLVDEDGSRPEWRQLALRMLVAPFSLACLGLGYAWLYGDRRQTWHDRASRTYVVNVPKTT
jgi:uncharacterized RDD family membrane protein YckC